MDKFSLFRKMEVKDAPRVNRNQNLPKKNQKKCLCQMLHLVLFWCRIFGLTPISWSHPRGREFIREDGQCHFRISKFWMTYSIVLAIAYNSIFYQTEEQELNDTQDVFDVLFLLNECIYMIFSTLLTIFGILRSWHLVETLNNIAPFLQRGLMCQSSKLSLMKTSRVGIVLIVIQMILQFAALLFMSWNDDFANHHDLKDIIGRMVHNVPFMFYYLFCTMCAMYVALFMCFETAMLQTLTNGMRRPGDEDTHGTIVKFGRCTGSHPNTLKADLETGTLIEELDCLRRFHEKMRMSLISANQAFNPQIPIHLLIELGVIIMHLYSIVLYFNQEFKTPDMYTVFLLDLMFVTLHSSGLLLFLLSATGIKMTQAGPSQQISEYSSKHLGPEEYAEMRLFGLKLEYVPVQFTAGRMFAIDVSLLAPIAGSVVTYLLVALQFRLPKEILPNNSTNTESSIIF